MKSKRKHKNIILVRLGEQIRDLRTKKGISQETLAELAAVHRTYIGMIERGEKNVTIITLKKLCDALEVSLTALVEGLPDGK